MENFVDIIIGVVSSVLIIPLIYILKVTNFLYLNDYVKIKSFLNSYHEYYILNLNQGNSLSSSGTSKIFDKKDYGNYEFILMIKDYELYNSLNKFELISKDEVLIDHGESIGEVEFKKSEKTKFSGNDIILINTNNPIFTRVSTKVTIEEGSRNQGVTLHYLPRHRVERVSLQKLLKFNLLTCIEKSFPTVLFIIIVLSTLIGCRIGFYIGCVI
jgi:hypothetical protein